MIELIACNFVFCNLGEELQSWWADGVLQSESYIEIFFVNIPWLCNISNYCDIGFYA